MTVFGKPVAMVGDGCRVAEGLLSYKNIKIAGETIRYANALQRCVPCLSQMAERSHGFLQRFRAAADLSQTTAGGTRAAEYQWFEVNMRQIFYKILHFIVENCINHA